MSLMISRAEGVTVFTVTSNPKSKWPLLCQLLGTLCYSPVCSVSQSLKQKMGRTHTVLGTLQILVGLMNVGFGCIFRNVGSFSSPLWNGCFWLGAVFIVAGIVCILAEKFPSSCLLSLMGLVNLVSAALAITATVFYSIDLVQLPGRYNCKQRGYSHGYGYGYEYTTPSQMKDLMENCEHNQHIFKMVYGGLDILLIVLAVLQLCVTVSSCVLILKTLCKKKKGDEMEDPELRQPLVEEDLSSSAY
uniref:Transmembrane protein 176l.2 n=1 Tax=Pygocentrus nattereri TaxID=42514 RepID=A0AAR2KZT8_PYGNA